MAEAHLLAALGPARRAHMVELGIAVLTREVLLVLGTLARVDLDAHAVERREAVVPRRVGFPEGQAGVGFGDFGGPPGAEVVSVLRPFAEMAYESVDVRVLAFADPLVGCVRGDHFVGGARGSWADAQGGCESCEGEEGGGQEGEKFHSGEC